MTTRAKVTTKAVEVEEDETDNSGPIVVKSSGKKQERIVLFTIDDDEFSVPAKPGVNVSLQFLEEMRTKDNEMFAAMALLKKMLGADKYAALLDYDELSDELLGQILEQVVSLAMDRIEGPTGK